VTHEWSIRLAQRRDVPDLLVIEESQFPEPWTKGMLIDEITNTETRRYTVAIEKKTIVGYLGVMFVIDELHVNTIGTLPGFEGRGIASALLDDAWSDAHARNIKPRGCGLERTGYRALLPLRLSTGRGAQELLREIE
jgi:ribosomal-protein-alanine N-acetyltransferase